MKHFTLLLLASALLSGCATVSLPRDEIAHLPITIDEARGTLIEQPEPALIDGRLVVHGKVRRIYRWFPADRLHLDVEFLDAHGEIVVRKSAALVFTPTRYGPPFPATFEVDAEPWPEGTTAVLVRTHLGYKHRDSAR